MLSNIKEKYFYVVIDNYDEFKLKIRIIKNWYYIICLKTNNWLP